MARARNPKREEAFQLYLESNGQAKLKDIAVQVGIPDSRIRKWKTEDKWDDKIKERSDSAKGALLLDKGSESEQSDKKKPGGQPGNGNAKGHGAPKGNKNAVGNKGGAPQRNTNAVTTGEHRTVWMDYLSEEEQAFYDSVDTSTESQIDHAIRIFAMKERWCMQAIHDLRTGLSEKCKKVLAERKDKGEILKVYDESGKATMVYKDNPELMVTEITETEFRKIDDILKQEETLIKIQNGKAKQLALKHKIDIDCERLKLEREKARLAAANLLRLNSPAESDVPGMNEASKVVFYIPDNGRDDHG